MENTILVEYFIAVNTWIVVVYLISAFLLGILQLVFNYKNLKSLNMFGQLMLFAIFLDVVPLRALFQELLFPPYFLT